MHPEEPPPQYAGSITPEGAPPIPRSGSTAADLYRAYEEYSKTLRTWLVAYGIGAPVLFLTNDALSTKLLTSGSAQLIAGLFLAGVAVQVFLAALNKTVMWACYHGEVTPTYQSKPQYRLAGWISEQYLIDFVLDVASIALFAVATVRTFRILVAAV